LWDTTQHYRRAFSHLALQSRTWVINAEHRLLIQSLRDGDADEAERILELHIRRTRIELRSHPEVFDNIES
jgi:DNA-binding GntR family transcriptional regulator